MADLGTCGDCRTWTGPSGSAHDPARCPQLRISIACAERDLADAQRRLDSLRRTQARADFESGFEPTDSLSPDSQQPEGWGCRICMNDLGHCCQHDGECAEAHPEKTDPPAPCGATLLINERSVEGCMEPVGHEGAHVGPYNSWTGWRGYLPTPEKADGLADSRPVSRGFAVQEPADLPSHNSTDCPAPEKADPHAGHRVTTVERWDSSACLTCNVWIESACECEPGTCDFLGRPATPEKAEVPDV